MTRRHGWASVLRTLTALGADTVFALPDDSMELLAASSPDGPRIILCRDQRNAVQMAVGHASMTGRPGIAIVGRGPAVTNCATGLLEANAAAVPLLLLASGTGLDHIGTRAFQELDQMAVLAPLTKRVLRANTPQRIPSVVREGWTAALGAPAGPVYVEIPEYDSSAHPDAPDEPPIPPTAGTAWPWPQRPSPDPEVLRATAGVLRESRRPVILVGGGCRADAATGPLIERLADQLGAAVFTTASGRGVVDETRELFCGVAGLYTVPPMDAVLAEADLVIALGSRLEETAMFGRTATADQVIIQVVDNADSVSSRQGVLPVIADAGQAVSNWSVLFEGLPPRLEWIAAVTSARRRLFAAAAERTDASILRARTEGRVSVPLLLSTLSRVVPPDLVLVQENGLQDMWSYFFPHWVCGAAASSLVPSEQTPLGYGAAAAVGVAAAAPGRPVVALTGDGAFAMFRNDLVTAVDAGLSIMYLVLDNGGYGWLQSNLERACGPRSEFTFVRNRSGALSEATRASGAGFVRIASAETLEAELTAAWTACSAGRTTVVEVPVCLIDHPPGMIDTAGDFPIRDDQLAEGNGPLMSTTEAR